MSGLRSSSLTEVIPFEADAYIVELDVTSEAGGVVHRTLRESGARVEGGMPLIVGLKGMESRVEFRLPTTRFYPKTVWQSLLQAKHHSTGFFAISGMNT